MNKWETKPGEPKKLQSQPALYTCSMPQRKKKRPFLNKAESDNRHFRLFIHTHARTHTCVHTCEERMNSVVEHVIMQKPWVKFQHKEEQRESRVGLLMKSRFTSFFHGSSGSSWGSHTCEMSKSRRRKLQHRAEKFLEKSLIRWLVFMLW